MEKEHIIERVANLSGLLISDLHNRLYRMPIIESLNFLKEESYDIEEWNELIQYICEDDELEFYNVEHIVAYYQMIYLKEFKN